MTHDPLCVEPQTDYPCKRCWEIECECLCICDILAKARRDEANRVMQLRYQEVAGWQDMKEALAWQQGQRDMLAKCIAEVERLLRKPGASGEHYLAALLQLQPNPSNRESIHDRTDNGTDETTREKP